MSSELRRILVIRTSAMGDLVLAIPALRAAAAAASEGVDLLTDPPYAAWMSALPMLREVHAFDAAPTAFAQRLRSQGYDLVIDLQNKARTALLTTLLRPPRLLRNQKRDLRWALGRLQGDRLLKTGPASLHYQREFETVGLGVDKAPPTWPKPPVKQRRGIGLQIGGRHAIKSMAPARLAQLARVLEELGELTLIGGPGDLEALAHLSTHWSAAASFEHTCQLSLPELTRRLAQLKVYVGFDSGPAHLAAALGVPTVALFGPTDPQRWAPAGEGEVVVLRHPLDCAPCTDHAGDACPLQHHACLEALPDEEVLAAVRPHLDP